MSAATGGLTPVTKDACRAYCVLLSAALFACSEATDHTSQSLVESVLSTPTSTSGAPEQGAVVFRSDRDQAGVGELYVMAPDGSNVRRLTSGGDYSTPMWSPDGASIAFRQITTGLDAAVGLVSPSGDAPVLLVTAEDPELWDYVPGWFGEQLMYASHAAGPDTDLWVVSRSGGQRRFLFASRDGRRYEADISRTDARIAFTWRPSEEQSAGHGSGQDQDVWVARDVDDPAPENLTEGRVYAPQGPRWSPDGRRIAFWGFALLNDGTPEGTGDHSDGASPPDSELFLIDVSSHELSRLTDNDQDDQTPAWTGDGNSLIFMSARDGDEDIWRMAVDAPGELVNLVQDVEAPSSDVMPDCLWRMPPK